MKCKYCPETNPINFYKDIPTVCKACRKRQVAARKGHVGAEITPVVSAAQRAERQLLDQRLQGMRNKNRDLELDLEDERQSRLKLEEELEALRAAYKNNAGSLAQVTDLQNEVAELEMALSTMRVMYTETYFDLETQKKLNKNLIAGLLG